MLVTLARASLVLSSKNVAAEALDGLSQYSHCWLIYVFHENTDLPGLWKQPPHKDFKAKVMKLINDTSSFYQFCWNQETRWFRGYTFNVSNIDKMFLI